MIRYLFIMLLLMPVVALAQTGTVTTPADFPATMGLADEFLKAVPGMVDRTLSSPEYKKIYRNLFLGFGLIFLVITTTKFFFSSNNLILVDALLLVGVIGSATVWYGDWINALMSFSLGLGDMFQLGILGNANPNYPVEFMFNVTGRYSVDLSWNPLTWISHIMEVVILALVTVLFVLLAMASVIASVIQSYLYIPLAITGLIVLPFTLIPMFSFLFDGWLRLFFTMVFFGVFVRVMIAIAVFALSHMFNVHDISSFDGRVFEFSTDNIARLMGAASIALVSLWAVLNCYSLATGIVSGMGGAMFGGGGSIGKLGSAFSKMKGG